MSLSAQDLYRLEIAIRLHADMLRKEWPESADRALAEEMRPYARNRRAEAGSFDVVANLLVGMQGDWDTLGPLVRAGYQRVMTEHERMKERGAATDEEGAAA